MIQAFTHQPKGSVPSDDASALQRLEALARAELGQLRAQVTASTPPPAKLDPILASLAWDLGLDGHALQALGVATTGSQRGNRAD